MSELIKRQMTAVAQASEAFVAVQTMGGRMHVRWDETAQATPHGQIVYFAEFLATAGIFESWVQSCPLRYSSPNAPGVLNMAALRTRLATKAPNSGGTLEPNEYALQMLRFPFRQVFGDPDNQTESERFYALDEFKAKVALTTWKSTVATSLAKVNP